MVLLKYLCWRPIHWKHCFPKSIHFGELSSTIKTLNKSTNWRQALFTPPPPGRPPGGLRGQPEQRRGQLCPGRGPVDQQQDRRGRRRGGGGGQGPGQEVYRLGICQGDSEDLITDHATLDEVLLKRRRTSPTERQVHLSSCLSSPTDLRKARECMN